MFLALHKRQSVQPVQSIHSIKVSYMNLFIFFYRPVSWVLLITYQNKLYSLAHNTSGGDLNPLV